MQISDVSQTADWKSEKHVPAIEVPETMTSGEPFDVTVSVGKEIAHPNTTEHHIAWIDVYFKPDGDKFAYQVGHFNFRSHGASTKGPNTGPVYTHPIATFSMTAETSGTLIAVEHCNIHGLWENSLEIKVK
jgi:superoxide reductase